MGLLDKINQTTADTILETTNDENDNHQIIIDKFAEAKKEVHSMIIYSLNKISQDELNNEHVKKVISEIVDRQLQSMSRADKAKIEEDLYNDIMGYGPIENLLSDPDITEIMVNGPKKIFYEKKGKISLSDVTFRDEEHVMNIIDKIVSGVGRHIDEASPMVDARLADGSRVNAVIPPISLVGPVITIRKFSKTPFSAQKLIEYNSITQNMVAFLKACVVGKLNVVVSGGTGSGKTTLLNVLSSFIPKNERIITIEDAAELQLIQEHVITLESRPSNLEGNGQISIRDLVRNALRMRPDRIIVGEVRSGEALDMLQAMNTGHDGSLTTTHANTPRDALSRIETMVLMSGMELPLRAIREQISSAIDIVVQQSRMSDGSRKVISISEVCGMEGDTIILQEIFNFKTSGQMDSHGKFMGHFNSTGVHPQCLNKIKSNGVSVYDEWFK